MVQGVVDEHVRSRVYILVTSFRLGAVRLVSKDDVRVAQFRLQHVSLVVFLLVVSPDFLFDDVDKHMLTSRHRLNV